MYEQIARGLVIAIYLYFGVGCLSALVIVPFGLARVDSEAKDAGVGFRLIVLPGAIALWPVVVKRFLRGTGEPPIQKDPHR